ncbi:EamA family transporter [Roseovarius faecimaris]|uniref:EamA family transporter n=1 Tax=Roseovarius faecimaris TaxID=2494550 RepID=A0A6I6IL17_9RHOB|nr:DMT family transporter [Roseovarius faecimaris]QGX97730.1 EamA family transporter [Roseovarius faecimaris]
MHQVTAKHWILLAGLAMVWGASFMFMSVALRGVGPLVMAASRISLGALALLIVLALMGRRLPSWRGENGPTIWAFALAMALFSNAIPFFLLGWGQQVVASGFAGVCMAVVPLLILPLAHVFVPGERMSLRRLTGFVMGTLGVIVLIGPAAFASTGADLELLAKLACVAAAACYSVGSICTRLCPEVDRIALSAAVLSLASIVLVPVALAVEGWPESIDHTTLLALLYLGVLPTGVAQVVLVIVNREAGPVFFSLVNYQVPLWSVFFGSVFLLEPLPPSLLLGLALILSGVALSQLGRLRKLFSGR